MKYLSCPFTFIEFVIEREMQTYGEKKEMRRMIESPLRINILLLPVNMPLSTI